VVTTKSVGNWTAKLQDELRRKLGCPVDAKDLAQEARRRFLQARCANKPVRSPCAYLLGIGRRLLYCYHKTLLRWHQVLTCRLHRSLGGKPPVVFAKEAA